MLKPNLTLKELNPKTATEADFIAFNAFSNAMRAELEPLDPPRSVEFTMNSVQNLPPFVKPHLWVVWHEEQIIAFANIFIMDREDNKHLAQASVSVLKDWRQQGIAKELMKYIVNVAQQEDKSIIIEDTSDAIPASEIVMNKLGAKAGMQAHTNQLLLTDLDWNLMQTWQDQAKQKAEDYELLYWEDAIPESHLNAYASMAEVMNTAPTDDLDVEDFKVSPEEIRQQEASFIARGIKRYTVLAKQKDTGELAGFTEIFWNPENPAVFQQESTAVLPSHRGKSIGRWLKASMILDLKEKRPEGTRIKTGNADSNDAMLKINNEMGFKPYKSVTVWQLQVDDLASYLAA